MEIRNVHVLFLHRDLLRIFTGIFQAQGKEELRSRSRFAAYFQGTAHHLHQAAGYGQSQSRSSVAGSGKRVRLLKGIEDSSHGSRFDADSRIRDGKTNQRSWLFLQHLDPDRNAAKLRKFDGISNNIDQNLVKPQAVCPERPFFPVVIFKGQLQMLLLGLGAE